MNQQLRAALISGAIIFGLSFGLSAVFAIAGKPWEGPMTWIIPTGIGLSLYSVLSNNRRVPKADAATRTAALAFEPPPGAALLVVYRQGVNGTLAGIDVIVDDQTLAQLKSPRFTSIRLSPGPHHLEAKGSQTKRIGPLVLDLRAGDVAFVQIKMGLGKMVLLRQDDPRPTLATMPYVEQERAHF